MKLSPTHPIIRLAILLTTAGISPVVSGQNIPEVAPEIVSAWKADVGDALLIFRYDGVYFQVQDDASRPGMERGSFTWNKASEAFSATTLRDTNGESGLSHPTGATTLSISGNTLTYTVVGEGDFTFSRVVNTTSAIVGSWFIPGDPTTVTFLAGSISGNLSTGTYYSTEEEDDAPLAYDGMERGTYTWNSSSKVLTATAITDTNGDTGLTGLPPGFTATIVGNAMTVPDDDEETPTVLETKVLRRLTQLTPLNVKNDFEVDKFINYVQTGAGTPAFQPIIEYPFWGEAYIQITVPGTGGTLTIGSQAARPFLDDDEWQIESEYPSLAELNASDAFPNGANYLFARAGGSATLSFPAGGTFPPAPEIVGDVEDGTWTLGVWRPERTSYVLSQNQTLAWTPHTNYDPATHVTILTVEDYETNAFLLDEVVIQGDINSYDFSGKLVPGRTYGVQLEHVKIASSTKAGTGPFMGLLGYALYNSSTRFEMTAASAASSEPVITQQPVSQIIQPAAVALLAVGTTQDEDTHQWFKNGSAIPGQTGNSLTLHNFEASDVASYTVTCNNPAGSVTSQPATLILPTTNPGPQILGFTAIPDQLSTIQSQTPAISAGEAHSLFLKSDGSVWATGKNVNGQLGNGSLENQNTPIQVFDGVVAISAYYQHSLLLKADGTAWSCGWNQSGQLGYFDSGPEQKPVLTQVLNAVTRISAGERHSLFVKSDGSAWATGGNANGQLGTGDIASRTSPVQVLTGVANVAAGYSHSLFLKTNGSVWAAGANYDGQLGTGDTTARSTPIQVMTGVAAVSAGEDFSLFLKTDGTVWATGYNSDGQLGTGNLASRSTPVQILSGVTLIEAGYSHSLFVKADGTAWATGANSVGQLATGSASAAALPVQVMVGVRSLDAGGGHSLFLKTDGSIRVAGNNSFGQFGVASPASTATALQVFQTKAPTLITLAATSTSGLPITYTILSGPATLSGGTLTVTGVGTIVVRASQPGNVLFAPAAPVNVTFSAVESDPFLSFVASLPIGRRAAADDFDNDGIPNLLEFLFGGNPTLPSSGLLPEITKAPGSNNLVFTYKRKLAATGVTQVIEHATSLSQPWIPAVHGEGGVTIVTAPVPGDATAEQVTATIPSTSTSRFVRLEALR